MFGKPEWFQPRSKGRGITPANWRGWIYNAAWGAAFVMPTLLLLSLGKLPETAIWMACSGGAWFFDRRSVAKQLQQQRERDALFYIGDDAETEVATPNYDLRTRQGA